jgi:hypothetical protein
MKMFRTSKTEGMSASSTPMGGGQSALRIGGEGGVSFSFLFGKRKDGGGKLASSSGRGGHHQKEMVVVRVQEGCKKKRVPNLSSK